MDTKALKDKILQLAIQGKLVPQDENDEPASVLLERIKEEKEQLIKDKVIKKEKPLQEISEEEKLFDLPNGWVWSRLPNVTIFQEGPGILAKDFREEGIPLIRLSGMKTNIVSLEGCNYLDENMVNQKWKHFKLDLNDIVISSSASMGKVARVDSLTVGCIPYTGLIRFKVLSGILDEYFIYFMQSPSFMSQIDVQKSGTTIKHYGPTHLKNMIIPIPPLEEQKRILTKLDTLFKLIDELDINKQDLLQNISDARNKVLQLAIQGKLVKQDENDESASILLEKIKEEKERLIKEKVIKKEKPLPEISEEEKLFDLPNGWEWARLGNLGNIFNGNSINAKLKESKYSNIKEGYNYIATKDIDLKSRIINYENGIKIPFNEEKFRIAHKGAVLICAEGASAGKKIGLVKEDICFGNKLLAIELFYKTNSKYLFYLYQSTEFSKIFSNLISGIVGGISSKNFKEISIPLPPLEEQKRIVAKVDTIMNYLDELEKQINQ